MFRSVELVIRVRAATNTPLTQTALMLVPVLSQYSWNITFTPLKLLRMGSKTRRLTASWIFFMVAGLSFWSSMNTACPRLAAVSALIQKNLK